jgi:hypothetical protein
MFVSAGAVTFMPRCFRLDHCAECRKALDSCTEQPSAFRHTVPIGEPDTVCRVTILCVACHAEKTIFERLTIYSREVPSEIWDKGLADDLWKGK